MKQNETNATYAQMGMTAMLPGMIHVLEIVQRQIDDMRAQIQGVQNAPKRGRPRKEDLALPAPAAPIQGQPRGGAVTKCPYCQEAVQMKGMHMHVKSYHFKQLRQWQALPKHARYSLPEPPLNPPPRSSGWPADPAERKREMARRVAARQGMVKAKGMKNSYLHVSDPKHPKHKQWKAKIKQRASARWDNMTEGERKEYQNKMQAGKAGKHVNGKAGNSEAQA